MATNLQDGNTPCLAATPSDPRPTVLVFDSGVGGLSVYNEIRQLLPNLHYIYAFDNVAFPYGEKSEEFIVERVVEIVTAVQQRYSLALAVIACNTASTVSLPALREKFAFPVVGVVPAIKPAARLTANGIVGLLATRGTVKRPYTRELIDRFANECRIEMLGSAELVELAEAKLHGEPVPLEELRRIPVSYTHLELIRGKCGRVQGALTGMMMTLKGLPLAYNKDMQEDKEGLFDALDTWLDCLHMAALVLDGIQVKRPRCAEAAQQGYANATELADYLVAKGVPFREAHHIVGEAVVEAIAQGKPLEALTLADLQKFSPVIADDVYPILSLQSCLEKRAAKGGVSPQQVAQAINEAKARLS